jgi:hypothetical protein
MIDLPEIKHALAVRNDASYLDGIIDLLVTKWEARAGIKDFRMRPWLPKARIREAHLQHWEDIELSKLELKRAG